MFWIKWILYNFLIMIFSLQSITAYTSTRDKLPEEFVNYLHEHYTVRNSTKTRKLPVHYYKNLETVDSKYGPQFKEEIRYEDLREYPYYFKKYNPYINRFLIYEYYEKQIKKGTYIFEIFKNKTKKMPTLIKLRIAIWYNAKGLLKQKNIYYYNGKIKEIYYYNDYGVVIKHDHFEPNGQKTSDTDATPDDLILGDPEY